MIIHVLLFIVGVALLSKGSDVLIDNASLLGLRINISPIIIGITIVAFGTSLPELVVSLQAVFTKSGELAFGNIVGSNISNIALILGVAALIKPVKVDPSVIRKELPFLIVSAVILLLLSLDKVLGFWDGLVMLACFVFFMYFSIKNRLIAPGASQNADEDIQAARQAKMGKTVLLVVVGLLAVMFGAQLTVSNAVKIALYLGVSKLVIGLSVVAIGTSLPELAASVAASLKEKGDISLGNVVGSNIFNTFLILALAAVCRPIPVTAHALAFELPVMLLFSLFVLLIMTSGYVITRMEGLIMVLSFITFLIMIFL